MIHLTAKQLYSLFVNRTDVFALQQPDSRWFPEKRILTLNDIQEHLDGKKTIANYCLDTNNNVKWACIDIDIKNINVLSLRRAKHKANEVYKLFNDVPRMLEFSGRRGYHVWLFAQPKVQAGILVALIKSRLTQLESKELSILSKLGIKPNKDVEIEVFPKQIKLDDGLKYGSHLKMPLCVHLVSKRKSQILKMNGIEIVNKIKKVNQKKSETFINRTNIQLLE